jgi:hypothetical protein
LNNWNGIVSLFIACIEILLLVNLLIFSEKNRINVIIYFIIALLTAYQLSEYLICGLGLDSSEVAYLAFADISFLPPLNLLLILVVFGIHSKFKYLIFIPPIFFLIYYYLTIEQFAVVQCTVLYATYNYPMGDLYGLFYYLPLVVSLIILIWKKGKIVKQKFILLFSAHLFIVVPVAAGFILLYLDSPGLVKSMESILCKFAFGYAVALSILCLNNKISRK